MAGSAVGLVAAGWLADALGSFGRAFAVLAIAPVVVAALVLLRFPETARRELEDLNPEDRLGSRPPPVAPHPPPATDDAGVTAQSGSAAPAK
jgi:hypothetical protein